MSWKLSDDAAKSLKAPALYGIRRATDLFVASARKTCMLLPLRARHACVGELSIHDQYAKLPVAPCLIRDKSYRYPKYCTNSVSLSTINK
jgi:hypothetical protein